MEPEERQSGGKGTAAAAIAAIGSVIAASACCLPVLPFAAAAGFAGGSSLLTEARPYLLGAAVSLIALGFYQAWRAKKCSRTPGLAAPIVLGISTLFVGTAIFFPQAMANAAADRFSPGTSQPPAGQPGLEILTPGNLAGVRMAFNAAKDEVRVMILLSPT